MKQKPEKSFVTAVTQQLISLLEQQVKKSPPTTFDSSILCMGKGTRSMREAPLQIQTQHKFSVYGTAETGGKWTLGQAYGTSQSHSQCLLVPQGMYRIQQFMPPYRSDTLCKSKSQREGREHCDKLSASQLWIPCPDHYHNRNNQTIPSLFFKKKS